MVLKVECSSYISHDGGNDDWGIKVRKDPTIDIVVLAAARLAVKRLKYFAAILSVCFMPVIEIRTNK